jgi:hypothetical protein
MLNADQILEALNDLRFCAECHRELVTGWQTRTD